MKAMIVKEFDPEKMTPVLAGAICGILFAVLSGFLQSGWVG